jgi:hypothetical protein
VVIPATVVCQECKSNSEWDAAFSGCSPLFKSKVVVASGVSLDELIDSDQAERDAGRPTSMHVSRHRERDSGLSQ